MSDLAQLQADVGLLLDRAAISDTLIAFAHAIDTKDWSGYADLYTEDGVLTLPFTNTDGSPGGYRGRAGLAEFVEGSLGAFVATHHLSGNHQITVTADRATARSYCQCIHRVDTDPGNVWELGGWYECDLRREADGRWRFSSVALTSVWEHTFRSRQSTPV